MNGLREALFTASMSKRERAQCWVSTVKGPLQREALLCHLNRPESSPEWKGPPDELRAAPGLSKDQPGLLASSLALFFHPTPGLSQAPQGPFKADIRWKTSVTQNPPVELHPAQQHIWVSSVASLHLIGPYRLWLSVLSPSSSHLLPGPPWPVRCSQNTQGLCTCYTFHLECLPLTPLWPVPMLCSGVCANVTLPMRHPQVLLYTIAHPSSLSTS